MQHKRPQQLTPCVLLAIGALTGATAGAQAPAGPAAEDTGNRLKFSAGDQFAYDDNLFRLPSPRDGSDAGVVSRADHINTVNLGMDGHWVGWRQQVDVVVRAADNRFTRNNSLNNVSGNAKVTWDWLISPRLSGTAGYDFTRVLASFANTFFFSKDLVDTSDYFATGGFRLAQHWQITGGLKGTDATHSAFERRGDQFNSKSGNLGVRYLSSAGDSFGFGYAYTDGHFPHLGVLNGIQFDRSYKDSLEQVTIKYQPGGKTELDARAGYLKRRYPDSAFGSFSGNTWHATLTWQPTGKTQLVFAGWRELTAYLDAESDYFVSKGGSVTATWMATSKISIAGSTVFNSQSYINTSPSTVVFDSRHDNLRTQQLSLGYSPRDLLSLQLAYRYDVRDSNRSRLNYIDRLVLAQITLRL